MVIILYGLLGLAFIAVCIGIIASIKKKPLLSYWTSSIVALLAGTTFLLEGRALWLAYISYAVGIMQMGVAIFAHFRQSKT